MNPPTRQWRLYADGVQQVRAAQRQALTQQQAKNVPELAFWEDHLGMRIDGAGVADHLKITFTHLSEPDVESWFVVSMAKRDYEGTLRMRLLAVSVSSLTVGCSRTMPTTPG